MQLDIVNYQPRPFRALFLLALGFVIGSILIPEYFAARARHYAGIHCVMHQPPPPMPQRMLPK
jgi:hypothetical protein